MYMNYAGLLAFTFSIISSDFLNIPHSTSKLVDINSLSQSQST